MGGYSTAAAARKLTVPLRAINGDLYPTDVAAVRAVKPGFEVKIMKHMGHYPMLERPDEFNRLVAEVVAELTKSNKAWIAAPRTSYRPLDLYGHLDYIDIRGLEMKESLTITTAKARLSELVNRLIHRGDTIFITRKGKNVAVLLPAAAYRELTKKEKPGTALRPRRALADLDQEIDDLCALIYEAREKAKDRGVSL